MTEQQLGHPDGTRPLKRIVMLDPMARQAL